ncbi:ATPase [Levilactobacillus fujinensis]|uniref:ATPase n=2 Tax=Levilactobacillus fujinensis TaxID=2486024 RepID=A0ABW1TEU7_9LACO
MLEEKVEFEMTSMVVRQLYLNRLKKYQDTEVVKVITGVRRLPEIPLAVGKRRP